MITWVQLWPILLVPTIVVGALSALPTVHAFGRVLGGGPVREWLLNYVLLPLLPNSAAREFVAWFAQAVPWQEWIVAALIAINLNALLLPVLYGAGAGIMRVSNWLTTTDLRLKRRAARR